MYLLLPGAGGAGSLWHPVARELERHGEHAVAVDFPVGGTNGIREYADAALAAADDDRAVTLVAQSMGAFTAAVVARRLPVDRLVFLNAMIPLPGETPNEWGTNTGHAEAMRANDLADGREPGTGYELEVYFTHDLTPAMLADLGPEPGQDAGAVFETPCDFTSWPEVPLQVIAGRDDRFFPLEFQRSVARERLGVATQEVDGGHLAAVSHPDQVARLLLAGP